MRLIDADVLKERAIRVSTVKEHCYFKAVGTREIDKAPTVDAVSRGCHDQVRWERDIALEQLKEHGIPFGGITPDVVKVVRCKDCKDWRWSENNLFGEDYGTCVECLMDTRKEHFCSYGERKGDE